MPSDLKKAPKPKARSPMHRRGTVFRGRCLYELTEAAAHIAATIRAKSRAKMTLS